MPIKLELDWGRSRRLVLGDENKAREIILGAKTVEDDTIFANKLSLSPHTVRNIRLGIRWKKLRKELEKQREQNI
jgi:hypothetical protein